LVKDFRQDHLSITAFAITGTGHESLFLALERLAMLEKAITGSELYDAIMLLRFGARHFYQNYPHMPTALVAEAINAQLDKLRTSPLTNPDVAHADGLATRLSSLLTFDDKDQTVIGSLNTESYVTAVFQQIGVSTAAAGAAGNNSKKRENAEPMREWLSRIPSTLVGAGACFDWLQKTGACANANHKSKCNKKDAKGKPTFVHHYPPGLSKAQYDEIDDWAKSFTPKKQRK
jgi:hypothetical protein